MLKMASGVGLAGLRHWNELRPLLWIGTRLAEALLLRRRTLLPTHGRFMRKPGTVLRFSHDKYIIYWLGRH